MGEKASVSVRVPSRLHCAPSTSLLDRFIRNGTFSIKSRQNNKAALNMVKRRKDQSRDRHDACSLKIRGNFILTEFLCFFALNQKPHHKAVWSGCESSRETLICFSQRSQGGGYSLRGKRVKLGPLAWICSPHALWVCCMCLYKSQLNMFLLLLFFLDFNSMDLLCPTWIIFWLTCIFFPLDHFFFKYKSIFNKRNHT